MQRAQRPESATDRFWCFHGRPEVIQIDSRLHNINPFYDPNWKKLDLRYRNGADIVAIDVPKPANLDEMLSVALSLSDGIDFVRVDLYNIHSKIYFGEMTFTPVAGTLKLPEKWDRFFGDKW